MKTMLLVLTIAVANLARANEVPAGVRQAVESLATKFNLSKPTFDDAKLGVRGEWRVRWDSYAVAVHPGDVIGSFLDVGSSERPALPDSPVRDELAAISKAKRWAANAGFPVCTEWKATLSSPLDDHLTRPMWTVEGWSMRDGLRGVGLDIYVGIDANNGHLSDLFWAGPYTYVSPKSVLSVQEAARRFQTRVKDKLGLPELPTVRDEPTHRWGWQVERDEFSDPGLPPADLTSRESRQVYVVTVDAGRFGTVVGRVDAETGAILSGDQVASGGTPAPANPRPVKSSSVTPSATRKSGNPPADEVPRTALVIGAGAGIAVAGWLVLRRR